MSGSRGSRGGQVLPAIGIEGAPFSRVLTASVVIVVHRRPDVGRELCAFDPAYSDGQT